MATTWPAPVHLWGRKPSARVGRVWARLAGRPVLFTEDGFLRSVRTGAEGDAALSQVYDQTGIYYDATRPSDLETLIESGTLAADGDLIEAARRGIALVRHHGLSKYNAAPWRAPSELGIPDDGDAVLVVDQTAGDLSLRFGGARAATFTHMLSAARLAHPQATLVVKTHPAVTNGHKRGHYTGLRSGPGLVVVDTPVNPWVLLERCHTVYVATSQLGFEALMAGCTVHCFGLPFYAGWGLTHDSRRIPRRRRRATLEDVFAAAYLRYCHYRDPYDHRRCTFEAAVEHLVRLRDAALAEPPATVLVGFDRWKRRWARQLFRPAHGPPARCLEVGAAAIAEAKRQGSRVVGWASRVDTRFADGCAQASVPFFWMEDGFLRSVGLGSALVPGASYVLDRQRPHYDGAGPSDLEVLLNEHAFEPAVLERAQRLREHIVRLGLSKYNVGRREDLRARFGRPPERTVVLVAGQVEDDMAILKGAPGTRTNQGLLEAARRRHPNAFIFYKPHPDVLAGLRPGHVNRADIRRLADAELTDVAASDVLDAVDHVEVMSSLIGFEALLRHKAVRCHGLPFYAGWGLTDDVIPCPRRRRRLTLDELVAGTLILYAAYVDPRTHLPCTPEHLLARLGADDRDGPGRRRRAPEALAVLAWASLVRSWRRLSG